MGQQKGWLLAQPGPEKHDPTQRRGAAGEERVILSGGHFAARGACNGVRWPPPFDHKMSFSRRIELFLGLIDMYSLRPERS